MGSFDTPNRMPMMYYLWKPTFASQPHRAKTRVVLAEIGSLSLEFTRLAQITKEAKYYDAVARITNEFEVWQSHTKLPGLWPLKVDASGCKKTDPSSSATPSSTKTESKTNNPLTLSEKATANRAAAANPDLIKDDDDRVAISNKQTQSISPDSEVDGAGSNQKPLSKASLADNVATSDEVDSSVKGPSLTPPQGGEILKRDVSPDAPSLLRSSLSTPTSFSSLPSLISGEDVKLKKPDCEPQGLASPPFSASEEFTLGGQADSTYEYLPKQYMLLGGLENKYRSMYDKAANAAKTHLIFRPMIPDEKRHILQAGLL